MASLRRRSPLRLCDLGSPGHALSSQIGLEPRRPFGATPTTHCDYDVGMGRRSRPGDTALGAPFTTGLTSATGPTSSPGLHDSAPYDTSPVRLHRTSPARTFVSGPASSARDLCDGPSPARPGPPSGLSETPPLKVARSSTGGYPSTPPMLPAAESGPVAEEGGSTLEVWALRGSLNQSERRRGLLADSLREACGALAEQASRLQRRQAELTDSRATVEELTVRQKYLESSIAALEKEHKQLGAGAGTHQRGLQERVRRLEEQISDARSSLDEVATETRRRRSLERVRLDAQALGRARTVPWPGASPSRCSVGPLLSASGAVTPLGCPHGCSGAGVTSPPHLASPAHLANGMASGRLAEDAWVRRTLMTQLDELKGERQTSAREKEQLASRVRALEEASAGLQTRVGAAEGERDRLKQERDELSKRAEMLAHDAESGARQKSGLEAELAEKAAELARVKGRAERVEEERARAVEELRALQTVRERQSAEVSDLRQKLETERERLLRHEAEGRLAGARAGALQGERDRLLAEKELAERERRQLQGQLDALRDAHESTRTALSESQARCSELESRCSELESRERAEGQAVSASPSPSRLGRTQDLDGGDAEAAMEAEWRARCEEANIVVETREAELQLATMQVRELEEECRRLRSQAQEHSDAQPHLGSASAGDTGEEVESLRRRLGENQELQQQQEKLIATLREELEEAMMKRPQEIRHSLDELDGELSVVRAEMERVWDELRSRDAALEDQQLELTSTRAQLASCSAERRGLEQEVATLRRELTHKEETCGSRERALAAEKTQLTVKLAALEMKVSEREMLDESRARSGSTLTEKLESLERENREFRQRHNKARAQAEDLAAKVQDLSRLNLALQEERDHAQRELRQICSGFQDLRDSTEIQKLRVRELEGVARHLQKDDQLKTTQLTALVIELRELRKAYQTVSGAEPSGGDPSHADWVSRSRIIRNAIEAIEGQAGRVRALEEELRAVRATPGFESLEAELQQLRKDAQANSNKVTALVIELKLLKEKNKKLMRDKIHLEQRLEDGGLSHDMSPDLSHDLSHGGRGKQAWGSTLAAEAGERTSQPTQLRPAAGQATTSPREERPLPLLASASPTGASASSSPRTTFGSLGSLGSEGGRSGGTPQPIGRPRHSSLSPVRRAEKATRGHRAWPRRSPTSHEDSTEGFHREDLVAGRRSDVEEGEDDVGDDDVGDDDDDDGDEDAGGGAMYNTGEFGELRSTPLPAGVPELPAFRSLSPLAGAPVSPPRPAGPGRLSPRSSDMGAK